MQVTRYNRLIIDTDDITTTMEPTSSMVWADIIHADFQTVISLYVQHIKVIQNGVKPFINEIVKNSCFHVDL